MSAALAALTLLTTAAPTLECAAPARPRAAVKISRGLWRAPVLDRLVQVIEQRGARSPGYDACRRPLAVLGWSAVITRRPPVQDALTSAVQAGLLKAPSSPTLDGCSDCQVRTSTAFTNASLDALRDLAAGLELSVHPEALALIEALGAAGWDVFVVTGQPEWLIRPHARTLGLDPAHLIGARYAAAGGVLGAPLEPVPVGVGQLQALRTRVPPGGRRPALVVTSLFNTALLAEAGALSIAVGPSSSTVAAARGWLVQPSF